jgi:hypothetical protein
MNQIIFEKGGEEKKRKKNIIEGGELVQGTLYACMELSQQSPLPLMNGNLKIKFKKF